MQEKYSSKCIRKYFGKKWVMVLLNISNNKSAGKHKQGINKKSYPKLRKRSSKKLML